MALANAKLQGLTAQLNLTGNRYNDALVSFPLVSVVDSLNGNLRLYTSL